MAQDCKWITVSESGMIEVSVFGEQIRQAPNEAARLRLQISDLIKHEAPPWAKKLMYGRKEALVGMPSEAVQCFEECGLMEDWDEELIREWYRLGRDIRLRRSDANSDTGLQAEKWTFDFEKLRVGISPRWISLDTSFAGFDILSQVSKANAKRRRIEVKGSELPLSQASFYVTNNEWGRHNSPDHTIFIFGT